MCGDQAVFLGGNGHHSQRPRAHSNSIRSIASPAESETVKYSKLLSFEIPQYSVINENTMYQLNARTNNPQSSWLMASILGQAPVLPNKLY